MEKKTVKVEKKERKPVSNQKLKFSGKTGYLRSSMSHPI